MNPLDRVELKVDKVLDILMVHSEVLAKHGVLHERNSEDLATHIKRTDLLETKLEKDLETALLPIKSFKFLTKLAAGCLTIAGILKLAGFV